MKANKLIYIPAIIGLLAFTRFAFAAEEPAVNPTGTWELRILSPGSNVLKLNLSPQVLKLNFEGRKLTGTLSRQAGSKIEQLPLEDAKLTGSEISFATHVFALSYQNNVLQPTDTNKVTYWKFKGQITGDTMTGKVEKTSWQEEGNRTRDWEAKRVKK